MNPVIETFLQNYSCEQVRPNHWEGKLQKQEHYTNYVIH